MCTPIFFQPPPHLTGGQPPCEVQLAPRLGKEGPGVVDFSAPNSYGQNNMPQGTGKKLQEILVDSRIIYIFARGIIH